MKILKLSSRNVKRLSAVEITPDGAVVVIGGKNGAGKSSVLDSITYALAGGDSLPKMPVRRGEDKARVRLDLGDYVVTRTFTAAGGTSLAITGKDGLKFSSPQALLDGLTGKLTFDPLEFSRQRPAQQAETLRALVGLDLRAVEQQEAKLFDERAVANRMLKEAEGALARTPRPAEGQSRTPASVQAAMNELQEAIKHNQANAKLRADIQQSERNIINFCNQIDDLTLEIERMKKKLSGLEADKGDEEKRLETFRGLSITRGKDQEVALIQARCQSIEADNAKVAQAQRYDEAVKAVEEARKAPERLEGQLEGVRSAKAKAIRSAKFPIEGLSLEATGVTMNGIPFEQCSSAEQLRVSVAIGLALNPKLKVLLIRDGSLLDEDSLKLVADMAAAAKAQVWIERVEETGTVSVIIEDGHVKGVAPEPTPEPEAENTDPVVGVCPDCGRTTRKSEGTLIYCTGKCGWSSGDPTEKPKSSIGDCPTCGAPMTSFTCENCQKLKTELNALKPAKPSRRKPAQPVLPLSEPPEEDLPEVPTP